MDRLVQFDELRQNSIDAMLERIDAYKNNWVDRDNLSQDTLLHLATTSAVQSIGSSTRIEGSSLTDDEVATLLDNMDIRTLGTRDEQEVGGYRSVLEIIIEGPPFVEFTRRDILGLHNELLRFAGKDQHHRGQYKQLINRVVATTPDGQQRTIFKTTEPMFVEREMNALFAWYAEHKDGHAHHPLVVIAAVVYEFLTIHPFQDGNGRLSRLLTTMLLLTHGYEYVRYVSLERIVEARKRDYYRALMNGQQWRGTEHENAGSFTIFFLKTMVEASETLERQLGGDAADGAQPGYPPNSLRERPAAYLSIAEEKVLRYFDTHEHLSVAKLDELLPEASRSTAKNRLKKLHDLGLLRRRGKGRATSYERV